MLEAPVFLVTYGLLRAHRGRVHGPLTVLGLCNDARRLEPQCVGGGDHVAPAMRAPDIKQAETETRLCTSSMIPM